MASPTEFEQALGVGDGQGSLVCSSPWGRKESDTTALLNNNNKNARNVEKVNSSSKYTVPKKITINRLV